MGTQEDLRGFDQSLLVGSGMALTKAQELQIKREEWDKRRKSGDLNTAAGRSRKRRKATQDKLGAIKSDVGVPTGKTAKDRFRDRMGRNDAENQPGFVGPPSPAGAGKGVMKAKYERLLRMNGPAVAKRYADSVGYEPLGGLAGRGITQSFRNRPNTMGTPQAMQQWQEWQQYQKFLRGSN